MWADFFFNVASGSFHVYFVFLFFFFLINQILLILADSLISCKQIQLISNFIASNFCQITFVSILLQH